VADGAVSRKRIGKQVSKRSRIDAHCYATVPVTVESRYTRQWIVQNTATEGHGKINCWEWCHIFSRLKGYDRHRSQREKSETEDVRRCQMSAEVRSETFILCGTVTVNFRVLALFVVTACSSYSKIESVIINCSSAWWRSNKTIHRAKTASEITNTRDRLCGLVVRVPGYRFRSPGFDSRRYQIFWEVVVLERGPLSLVRITEELHDWKSSGSGLENRN
jgi:hypothetical protein